MNDAAAEPYRIGVARELKIINARGLVLDATLWFPAAAFTGSACPAYGSTAYDDTSAWTDCVSAANLSSTESFPGVVFANGFASRQEHYAWFLMRMVDEGYVVLNYDPAGQGESEGNGLDTVRGDRRRARGSDVRRSRPRHPGRGALVRRRSHRQGGGQRSAPRPASRPGRQRAESRGRGARRATRRDRRQLDGRALDARLSGSLWVARRARHRRPAASVDRCGGPALGGAADARRRADPVPDLGRGRIDNANRPKVGGIANSEAAARASATTT